MQQLCPAAAQAPHTAAQRGGWLVVRRACRPCSRHALRTLLALLPLACGAAQPPESTGPITEVHATPLTIGPAAALARDGLFDLDMHWRVFPAIDRSDIEAGAATRLEDLADLVPGVQPGVLNAGLSSALMMRGFRVSRARWNGLTDVQRLFVRDLHTVEAVEIRQGPDGIMEGITSPGGVVSYRGKQPRFEPAHSVGIVATERGGRRVLADTTAPVNPWLAYRLVAATQSGRTQPGSLPEDRSHVLAGFTFRYSEQGALRFDTEHQRNKRPFAFGTVRTPARGVVYDRLFVAPDQPTLREYERHGLHWEHALSDQVQLTLRAARSEVERDEALLGFWSLRNESTLWGYYTRYRDRYTQDDHRAEAHFRFSALGLQHHVALGQERHRQHVDFAGVQNIAGFTVDIDHPDFTATAPATLALGRRYNHERIDEAARYAALHSTLADLVRLSLGLRDNTFEIRADRIGTGLRPATEGSARTWHAGLVIMPVAALSIHVAAGSGIEPNRGLTRDGGFLPEQRARQFEAGLRWATYAAEASANAYRIRLDNLPMADPLDRNALVSSGSRRVDGIELSGLLRHGVWDVRAHAAWTDTRNLNKTSASQGNAFPNVPRHAAGIRVARRLAAGGGANLRLWLSATHVGPRYGDAANSFRLPSHQRYDLGGEYRPQPQVRLHLGVRNLTNKRYVAAITSASDVYQGALRTAWAGLDYSF